MHLANLPPPLNKTFLSPWGLVLFCIAAFFSSFLFSFFGKLFGPKCHELVRWVLKLKKLSTHISLHHGTSCEASVKLKDATLEATRRRLLSGILVLLAWCYYSFHTYYNAKLRMLSSSNRTKNTRTEGSNPFLLREPSLLQLQQLE